MNVTKLFDKPDDLPDVLLLINEALTTKGTWVVCFDPREAAGNSIMAEIVKRHLIGSGIPVPVTFLHLGELVCPGALTVALIPRTAITPQQIALCAGVPEERVGEMPQDFGDRPGLFFVGDHPGQLLQWLLKRLALTRAVASGLPASRPPGVFSEPSLN